LDQFIFNVQTVAPRQYTTLLLGMQKQDTNRVQKRWKQQILTPNPCLWKSGSTLPANCKCSQEIQYIGGHSLS